jgi:hypothetical protein
VLPRPDLHVLLLSERAVPGAAKYGAHSSDGPVVAESSSERVVLRATEIPKYCEFPGRELDRFVVAVARR